MNTHTTPSGQPDPIHTITASAPRQFPSGPPTTPRFKPEPGTCYALHIPKGPMYVVEPSLRWPGFFFVSKMRTDSESVDCTLRPIAAEWVEFQLQTFGMQRPDRAAWRVKPSEGVLVALDTFPGAAE